MNELLHDALVVRPMNAQAAGQGDLTSGVVDMGQAPGFAAACFVLELNAVADSGQTTLTIYENAANSTSGGAAVTGASASHTDAGSGADSNGVIVVDVIRPSKRYLYAIVGRSGANVQVDSLLAILYKTHDVPQSQPAVVLASAVSTAEL